MSGLLRRVETQTLEYETQQHAGQPAAGGQAGATPSAQPAGELVLQPAAQRALQRAGSQDEEGGRSTV